MISQTFFSHNLLTAKDSPRTTFKSQDIGWSVNYQLQNLHSRPKDLHFYGISNFKNTKVLMFAVFVKALGSIVFIVFILSIKYTKSHLASLLKIWSKKLRWKSRGCWLLRSSHQTCSVKKAVLKDFSIFTALESLFIKDAGLNSNFIQIETPVQFSFCEYCGIFKNTYFEEHLPTAAFDSFRKNACNQKCRL